MTLKKTAGRILIASSLLLSSCASNSKAVNLTYPGHSRYADCAIAALPKEMPRTIKVVSYNIRLCEKFQAAAELLREHPDLRGADIICLQEMSSKETRRLAETIGYNYVYYPCFIHPGSHKDFGQAILSRWPVSHDTIIVLPSSTPDRYFQAQRSAVSAVVHIHDRPITVYSMHLGVIIPARDRKTQVRAVASSLPPETETAVVCGDFNTYARHHIRAVTEGFNEAGFRSATKNTGSTFRAWYLLNCGISLDHIFYKGLRFVRAGKVRDKHTSDHFPVWAEFE